MKYLILLLLLTSCGPRVVQSVNTKSYRNFCENKCQNKFNTHVESVGALGTCYCE